MKTELNTIRYGNPTTGSPKGRYIYLACPDCGKERWVNYYSLKRPNYNGRCKSCDAKALPNPFLYQGRFLTSEGYVMIQLTPDDFFYPMAEQNGYIKEHRLIMARYLNRCLMPFEIVHHRNGIRDDNRIENLKLTIVNQHTGYHNALRPHK